MMKKVKVTETELITIIKTMINEQEEGSEGGGTTGAKTWESGLTRGPANPAGSIGKWADTYSISRGKANPLWEDEDYEEYDDDEVDIDLLNESKWYNTFLDFVGVVDPTGVADAINAVSYFRQGDILYGILSLISLVPYVGDAIAKPFIAIMKSGKINTKIINAGLKSGNASKITAEMGKTKAGKAVLETMKNPTTQNFLGNILGKISKIPGFKNFSKDAKTYLNLFTQAAKQSGKIKVFRQSGGLLTRMQRKGLLNRTKLYSKFINYLMGTGVGAAAIEGMGENKLNSKFEQFLNSQDGMDFFNSMNKQDQGDFVDALK
jgi:hypothetical protein